MSIVTLLPFIVLIGAMFLMTRSAKKKQQAAAQMRNEMQAGTGVRTIGGMYATVKEVHEDTVLLEVAPGVHAIYAKNAVGAVLADEEYNRILDGADPIHSDEPVVPDDASSLTGDAAEAEKADKIDLGKTAGAPADAEPAAGEAKDAKPADEAKDTVKADADTVKDDKKSGDDAK
ncbi:preprotein translocase subunit YajC [Streptomyces sp. Je 1-4]|uniref:preprotein translocase subunit YajC n=1 Tax=Streptomyces TaxID=1883 RepID=UPI00140ECDD0|nr:MULTISPECIES: preprotein translocase subunit YajC [unclassified Streptomyces]QIK09793.1 preprotein translocase subunit YajC [Streptomyces sp. ID38640]UYB43507.1 preprotein translocase subunit YajC [Streptomyces sp. Je 1-4]UZQ39890.1 preprotein translocase subunit YajC [Streptomyces sp. Je 1-4] [Streptomyces sp. Je 1-4 4N24]UZQ47307.1 preprotein translocase subunit YajC [Streptomyces sp. Je 1-4] [Streptomyces sp. Je 1-4 4N24_ara]